MNATAHAQRTHLEGQDTKKPRLHLVSAPVSLIRPNLSTEDQKKFELGYRMAQAALKVRA
jgi:Flp pilus assembly CpaF family ATPase